MAENVVKSFVMELQLGGSAAGAARRGIKCDPQHQNKNKMVLVVVGGAYSEFSLLIRSFLGVSRLCVKRRKHKNVDSLPSSVNRGYQLKFTLRGHVEARDKNPSSLKCSNNHVRQDERLSRAD